MEASSDGSDDEHERAVEPIEGTSRSYAFTAAALLLLAAYTNSSLAGASLPTRFWEHTLRTCDLSAFRVPKRIFRPPVFDVLSILQWKYRPSYGPFARSKRVPNRSPEALVAIF